MTSGRVRLVLLLAAVAVLAAFGWALAISSNSATPTPIEPVDPNDVYDPVEAGESLPDGFRQVSFRDQIEPVYDPEFTSPAEVDWPLDSLVVGVAVGDTAKAYPVTHLTQREMVNDWIDDLPILVTWCPLCGSAMVHARELDGETLVLGTQGALWGNAMTWWDHGTGSIWSQPLGEAIAGPRTGDRLELLASTLTTWESWLAKHPDTLALDVHAWGTAFQLDQMAVVVDLGTEAAAYGFSALRDVGVVNDVVAGVEIAAVIDPADDQRWAVFSRRLDESVVELELTSEGLVDSISGTVFDPFLGVGRTGPLSGQSLDRLPAFTVFVEDYETFFPDGRAWPTGT